MLTGAKGPGRIAFSRDGAGHVFGLHLQARHGRGREGTSMAGGDEQRGIHASRG